MSVKAMGLVWDLECPASINGMDFRPSHKYLLIAYADHADHNGRNIWPAVSTMAKKTGLDVRTVQRLTSDMATMGLLLEDGQGPRGTNKWYLPISEGGDSLTPPAGCRGDKNGESLGDIPSGDIPSGDTLPPEFNKPEPEDESKEFVLLQRAALAIWPTEQRLREKFQKPLVSCQMTLSDTQLIITGLEKKKAEIYQDEYAKIVSRALIGVINRKVDVIFEAV